MDITSHQLAVFIERQTKNIGQSNINFKINSNSNLIISNNYKSKECEYQFKIILAVFELDKLSQTITEIIHYLNIFLYSVTTILYW